ncbi:MAG: translesion DNA synthesis-associated protein ImuA [Lysobacterales bacterium]
MELGLTSHPLLWRGKQAAHDIPTLSTGHTVLDEVLPGSGWPQGAVTELVNETAGCGELSLLLPLLARLSQAGHWLSMIDPPWIPYPPALHGHGLALEKLLLIRTKNRGESLWACEQIVRGIAGGAMLAWPDTLSFGETRRLQLAAERTQKTVFLFRGGQAANASSPAALRLQLSADDDDLLIRVLKCRGQKPAAVIRIRQPQLLQPLMPPRVSSSGSSKRSSSASESPVVSRAASRIGLPSL